MNFHKKQLLPFLILSLTLLLIALWSCNQTQTAEIHWNQDIDHALAQAKKQNKPLMIDFMATWCPPCHRMEDSTFSHPEVIKKTDSFITVRIDVDKQGDVANKYNSNARKYGGIGIPNILFLDKDGNELKHPVGYRGPEQFLAIMDSVLISTSPKK